MELIEAIKARHSVRKYLDRPIEKAKAAQLRAEIDRVNEESGLNVQLVLNEPKAFSSGLWKYGQFSGVENYFVMAGPKGKEAEEKIGYYGEQLVLLAQTIGLNTCWVGLTYKKIPGTFTLRDGDMVHCVISLGYGTMPGVQHPQKPAENFYEGRQSAEIQIHPPPRQRRGSENLLLDGRLHRHRHRYRQTPLRDRRRQGKLHLGLSDRITANSGGCGREPRPLC